MEINEREKKMLITQLPQKKMLHNKKNLRDC